MIHTTSRRGPLFHFQKLLTKFDPLRISRSTPLSCPVPLAISPVSTMPNRPYTVEDFTDLINARLQQLERRKEAQQRFGSLLVVLRQQVDAYRQRRTAS